MAGRILLPEMVEVAALKRKGASLFVGAAMAIGLVQNNGFKEKVGTTFNLSVHAVHMHNPIMFCWTASMA
jgi:hypothetical protein